MNRNLSLITPSGRLTLGNYLGAFRGMVAAQDEHRLLLRRLRPARDDHPARPGRAPVDDRRGHHAVPRRRRSIPSKAVLFRQSRVPAHRELAYLLECTAYTGELARMIQYKEKGRDQPSTRVSLYTYPVLMAADILLYRPTQVPVGDDQRQHVELTRDLAVRFNNTYGPVFTVPEIVTPPAGARVMDLQDPTRKMSKSAAPGADAGRGPAARPTGRRAPQDRAGGDRLRHRPGRRTSGRGEARRHQPARHPRRVRRARPTASRRTAHSRPP